MKKTTLLTTILLLAAMLISSCSGNAAETDASDSESINVTENDTTAPEQTEGDSAAIYQPLHLSEPQKQELPLSIEIEVIDSSSGTVENAEGEKVSYRRTIDQKEWENVDVEGDVSMLTKFPIYTIHSVPEPACIDISVNYSDMITLTTDENNVQYVLAGNGSYWSVPQITCAGNGQKKVIFEWEKDKITISGDDASYKFGPWLYYYKPKENYGEFLSSPRVRTFDVEGKTDGSVTLEKREDGWHLSGAEGEVKLWVGGSDDYNELHRDEFPIIITASPEDDIHIEEYIPEVQELYR